MGNSDAKWDLRSACAGDEVVAVWTVHLAQPPAVVARGGSLLSPDEQARAARFHFDRDREHFIVARAALRLILGECLGAEPATLRFSYSSAGKPSLAPGSGRALAFNLSHSHELALVAVTGGRTVGVDVEHARDLPELADIARRFFSPREAAALLARPAAEQPADFLRCWTRKEAYLKARGEGIVAGLDRFDVSFLPGEAPALLRTLDDPGEAARWTLLDLAPAPGYAAAVAVRGGSARLVRLTLAWPAAYVSG